MRHENIQKKLLSEAGLTLKKAIEISVAMETAAKDAVVLRNSYSDGQKRSAIDNGFGDK
jgi:hypothetical protein